jgi:hypothetical protein
MEFMILSSHGSVTMPFLKPTDRIMTGQNHEDLTNQRGPGREFAPPAQILKLSDTRNFGRPFQLPFPRIPVFRGDPEFGSGSAKFGFRISYLGVSSLKD